jgi:tRNA (uracil-5-)-methyltransferase
MAEVVPQTRPLSEVEVDPGEISTSVEKKPRLDIEMDRSEEQAVASTSTAASKQKPANGEKQPRKKASKKKKQKHLPPEPYSNDDVLWRDVRDLLGVGVADGIIEEGKEWESPFQHGEEVEVEVSAISSTGTPLLHLSPSAIIGLTAVCRPLGDGLAVALSPKPPWVVVVPFALPGEVARVKIHQSRRLHAISSLLEIKTPNPTLRDDSRIKCRYFGVCGGCQYQVSHLRIRCLHPSC